jgi:hypothetical protein
MTTNATLVTPIQTAEQVLTSSVLSVTKTGLSVLPVLKVKKEAKQPIYLKQGIKGKQLTSAKIDTNKAIKADRKSISSAIRDIRANNSGFLESFANYDEQDITPKNLLPLLK